MPNKYNARKITVNGIVFASRKEANRFKELSLLERAGVIQNLQMQVKFVLIPAQREQSNAVYTKGANKGKPKAGKIIERECSYLADFTYYKNGEFIVEDVKGYKKGQAYAVFTIKRKLMLYVHGIRIKEI